ncbi:MAG: hypothetical protein Q7R79_03045, partial [bacterium]|nr:hypothetical protein [bacterium]
SLTTTLEITRTHTGKAGELFTGKRNMNFMRIYTPEGSTVLSSEGFESPAAHLFKNPPSDYTEDEDLQAIQGEYHLDTSSGVATNNEFGKTVLSGWVQTDPGSTKTIKISYRLPFTIKDLRKKARMSHTPYTLLLQRQSGSTIKEYQVSLSLPDIQNLLWSHIPPQFSAKGTAAWSSSFSRDATFGFLLK